MSIVNSMIMVHNNAYQYCDVDRCRHPSLPPLCESDSLPHQPNRGVAIGNIDYLRDNNCADIPGTPIVRSCGVQDKTGKFL